MSSLENIKIFMIFIPMQKKCQCTNQFIHTKSIKLYQLWHMYPSIGSLEEYTPMFATEQDQFLPIMINQYDYNILRQALNRWGIAF